MNFSPTQLLSTLTDSRTGGISWLSALAGILLFALFNLFLTLLLPGKFAHSTHAAVILNAVAALAAIIITPFVLRSVDRMQQQVTRQNSELRSLHAIDRAISGTLDLQTLLTVAIKEVTLAVDGEFGALWLLGEDSHSEKTGLQAFYNLTPGMQILLTEQLASGIPDLARRTGVTQRRHSLDDTWKTDRAAAALKMRNLIVVPITEGETVLGLIQVGNRGGALSPLSGFSEVDEKLLGDLAATVSVAVQHARLYQKTLRRDEILRGLIASTGDAIAASSDTAHLMQILADEAARILSCRRVAVYEYKADTREFLPLAAHDDQTASIDTGKGRRLPESFLNQPLARAMEDLPTTLSGHPRGGELPVPYVQNAPTALGLDISEAAFLNSPGYVFILRSRDRRGIGLLCLLDSAPRLRQPDTAAFARALAAQASVTLENARLVAELTQAYAREKNISITLQESLMPEVSGRIGTVEFAHKYQSALEEAIIGGDFYDVFDLGEGRTGFVMADVSGKGLKAAVQTAMLKYTLRGFALETPDEPGRVLARVNDVLCSPMSSHDGFVTLFYGVIDTLTGEFLYANAGHEPPLLRAAATSEVCPLPFCDGLALGALAGVPYEQCQSFLAPGDLLLLYTDGLTEARTAAGEFLDQEGLAALIPRQNVTAKECVRRVYEAVSDFAGDVRRDDVAMLALRRLPG
jgi:serine phosphatase RsbU (regulator of sigma subunit)